MKKISIFSIALLFFTPFYTNAQCPDPTIQIISDCGTQFDLCLDSYVAGPDEGILLEIFLNDDLGIFDPCDSDTTSGTSNGTLTQLEDCNWFYLPDPGFVGNDTFFYELNYLDVCITDCYCSSGAGCTDGRIWTIDALYLGPDIEDNDLYDPTVLVKDKNGNTFSTHEHLSYGDEFFADGSDLAPSTTNYEYQLYLDGDTSHAPDQIEEVHVSCSELIFGTTFGFLRPISGCIAPTSQKETCAGVGDNFGTGKNGTSSSSFVVMGEALSVATSDVTMVVITIEAALPVDILKFEGESSARENLLSWSLDNYNSAKIELQKSKDATNYSVVYSSVPSGNRINGQYSDSALLNNSYYRLVIYDYNGDISYSDVVNITRSEAISEQIQVYPNPFVNTLEVQIPSSMSVQSMRIYNINGQLIDVLPIQKENNLYHIDLGEVEGAGIFFVELISENLNEMIKVLKIE